MSTISNYVRNQMGPEATAAIEVGSGAASYLEIWSGTKPSNPSIAGTTNGGTLLCRIPFTVPAFGSWNNAISHGTLASSGDVTDSGTAQWFRITNRDGTGLIDGTISVRGGGGDLQFDAVDLIEGGALTITSIDITVPKDCA